MNYRVVGLSLALGYKNQNYEYKNEKKAQKACKSSHMGLSNFDGPLFGCLLLFWVEII